MQSKPIINTTAEHRLQFFAQPVVKYSSSWSRCFVQLLVDDTPVKKLSQPIVVEGGPYGGDLIIHSVVVPLRKAVLEHL